MLQAVGHAALSTALVVALYGAAASVLGARKRSPLLVASARTAAYSLAALIAIAIATLLAAILTNDFSLAYVASTSSAETPVFYKVLSLWASDDGSLLLWNAILCCYLLTFARRSTWSRSPETFPWSLAVLYGASSFFLGLVVGPASPFATLSVAPSDGQGPPALLQNHPLMAIHPPTLYTGFIGLTVPFALAIGVLAAGERSPEALDRIRRWMFVAWAFLTAGILLGALWSYMVLGWGGYWAWDPVENLALLPWLLATAFLHMSRVQQRRGVFSTWNLGLVIAAYALTIFGTLLTRGNALVSVHAFAQSTVGPILLCYLGLVVVGGFALLAWRSSASNLRPRFSILSRETAMTLNNLLLLVIAFTVLAGTVYPLAVQALTGRQVAVGGSYFDRIIVPLTLVLLLLMALGPLARWGKNSAKDLIERSRVPAIVAAICIVAAVALGMRGAGTLASLGVCVFAVGASVAPWVGSRGIRGSSVMSSAATRLGGALAHVGLAVAVAGIVFSTAYSHTADVSLARGARVTFEGLSVRLSGIERTNDPQREVVSATLEVYDGTKAVAVMHPAIEVYTGSGEPAASPAVRFGTPVNGSTDLMASLLEVTRGGTAEVRLVQRPGMELLWLGGGLMAAGGALCAIRKRRRRRPAVEAPPTSVSTTEPVEVLA
jgi:cytochrome c-type biogenesis protein CcmF